MSGCRKLDRGYKVKHATVWVTVTVSFHFEKRTRWGYVWFVCSSGSLAITTSCDRLRRCSSYSCTHKLASILLLSRCCNLTTTLLHTHKALLVLIPMVMGLLSPHGSQLLQHQMQVQPRMMQEMDQNFSGSPMKSVAVCLWRFQRSVVVSTRGDSDLWLYVVLVSFFWIFTRSRVVMFWMMFCLCNVLCEVASVSQLSPFAISSLFLHESCKDTKL